MGSPADRCSAEPGCLTSGCISPDGSTLGCANPTLGDVGCCEPDSGCPCTPTSEVWLLPTPTADGSEGEQRGANTTRWHGHNSVGSLMRYLASRPQSTSSLAASHAAARPVLATAPGLIIPRLLSGSTCDASFARFDPATYSSKTSGPLSPWQRMQVGLWDPCGESFWPTWPRAASMSAGIITPLRALAPRTSVTGCSPLLGTPTARDGREDGSQNVPSAAGRGTSLMKDLLPLLPTPNASLSNYGEEPEQWEVRRQAAAQCHGNNGLGAPLPIAIKKLLPTPTSSEGTTGRGQRGAGSVANGGGQTLRGSLSTGASTSLRSDAGKPSTGLRRLRLSADFVGWMMGTPTCGACGREWTDPRCAHNVSDFRPLGMVYTSTSPTSSDARSDAMPRQEGGTDDH